MTGGDLGSFEGDGKAGTLFVGQRFGMFALEAGLSAYGFRNDSQSWDNVGLAAGGRFTVPVMPTVGMSVHAGIEKTWSNGSSNSDSADYTGTGWLAGLGVEYKLGFGALGPGAIWADYTRHAASFVNDIRERDGNVDVLSLGVTVGF
jgi:hypothetical protein